MVDAELTLKALQLALSAHLAAVQRIDKALDVPVERQRQVATVLTGLEKVEVSQVDEVQVVPEAIQRQVHVVQSVVKVLDAPVTRRRLVPTVLDVPVVAVAQRNVDVMASGAIEKTVDVPVFMQVEAPLPTGPKVDEGLHVHTVETMADDPFCGATIPLQAKHQQATADVAAVSDASLLAEHGCPQCVAAPLSLAGPMATFHQCSTADWNNRERIEDFEWTKSAPGMVRPVIIQWSAPSTGKRKSSSNGLAAKKGFVLGDARAELMPDFVHAPAESTSKSVFMDLVWPARAARNDMPDESDSISVCSSGSAL